MKRVLAALAGLIGIAWFRSRRQQPRPDPAEELRAKLAQAREADDREEFEAAETPIDEVEGVESRRREVHERARQQIDDLSGN